METLVRVELLSHLRVWRGRHAVDLGPRKQRNVFAMLALRTGEPVSMGDLQAGLWGERPPKSALPLIHTYVARLRQQLEPDRPRRTRTNVLRSTSEGYYLDADACQVDLLQFRYLVRRAGALAAAGEGRQALRLLGDAMRLCRPGLGPEFDGVLDNEVSSLRGELIACGLDFVRLGLEQGCATSVLPVAERLAAAEPFHEAVQATCLLTLNATGQRAVAVTRYRELRAQLKDELGVDPGPELVSAYQAVVRGTPGGRGSGPLAASRDAPRASRAPWRGLGPWVGKLVAREPDLEQVAHLLTGHRLVTLTGPAGCGKSALGHAVCDGARGEFDAGVTVVDLSDVHGVADLARRLSLALRGHPEAAVPALLDALSDQQMLLLFDNAESVVDGSADLVDRMLRHCPRVVVLVTSREGLGLPYEALWPVHPLSPPPPGAREVDRIMDSPAVRLFVRRACQVDPHFRLDAGNAATVAAICHGVDGLPLGIELASACLRTADLRQVARRLDEPGQQLRPHRRAHPPHHRSLFDALKRSYDGLTAAERRCFAAMGRVGLEFRVEALAAHGGPPPSAALSRVLDRLVEKSLLQVDHDLSGPRYRMLRSVRRFAVEMNHKMFRAEAF